MLWGLFMLRMFTLVRAFVKLSTRQRLLTTPRQPRRHQRHRNRQHQSKYGDPLRMVGGHDHHPGDAGHDEEGDGDGSRARMAGDAGADPPADEGAGGPAQHQHGHGAGGRDGDDHLQVIGVLGVQAGRRRIQQVADGFDGVDGEHHRHHAQQHAQDRAAHSRYPLVAKRSTKHVPAGAGPQAVGAFKSRRQLA